MDCYQNIFFKELLIETLNQSIKTYLQKQPKKIRKILKQEIGLCLKSHYLQKF